jgi:hypothetical protein
MTISGYMYNLYRNIYPITPVGGYVEFAYNDGAPTVYPLYCYQSPTVTYFSQGPWSINSPIFTSGTGFVSGLIVLPGFAIFGADSNDNTFCLLDNNTTLPLYSNVNTQWSSDTNYLTGYASLAPRL